MDAVIEAGLEDTGDGVEHASSVPLPCDAGAPCGPVYADQQCELKEGQVLHDDGEILLVQELQDFQGVVSETVVVDEGGQQSTAMPGLPRANFSGSSSYQQYQPLVVQGFVTSSGEVVHVVQDTPTSGAHRTLNPSANLPGQTYQHPYHHQAQHQAQPQMMHPDLYRLIKMFPDFSTKTLHRIFVMCRCDLKRSLDQALFARQFRQLDSQSYSAIAPSASPHFPAAPYRTPGRGPYMQVGWLKGLGIGQRTPIKGIVLAMCPLQMGVDLGDMYQPRGRASHGATAPPPPSPQSSAPILLYQQATSMQPLSLGQHLPDVDDAEVVEIKLADLSSDVQIGQSLGGSDSLGHSLGLLAGGGAGSDSSASLGPGGDSVEQGDKEEESKDVLPDLAEVTVEDSSHVTKTEPTVVC